jgi:hypothetical protein
MLLECGALFASKYLTTLRSVYNNVRNDRLPIVYIARPILAPTELGGCPTMLVVCLQGVCVCVWRGMSYKSTGSLFAKASV